MRSAKTGGFVKASAPLKRKSVEPAIVPTPAIDAVALAAVVDTSDRPPQIAVLPTLAEPAVPAALAAVAKPAAAKRTTKPAPVRIPPAVAEPVLAEPISPSIDAPAMPAEPASPPAAPQASDTPAPIEDPTPTTASIAAEEIPMNDTIQTATDKTQAMFADASERSKGAMDKGKVMVEEMTSFSKGNIEAMVESSKIAAKGIEAMTQDAASYAKTSFEGATHAMKTMATVKSPAELMKLQSDYMRTAFDALVAQTSRSTEAMMKLAGDVAQPLSSRMAIAADKVKIAA